MNKEDTRQVAKAIETVTSALLAFATVVSRRMTDADRNAVEADLATLAASALEQNKPELETMLIFLHQAIRQAPGEHQPPGR